MVVCVPKDGKFTDLMKRTLIHEIFHAVQERYGKSTFWWAESTAALSEVSMQDPAYQPQLTPDYSHREEWRALTAFGGKASNVHYRTQDWWYHVLREQGLAFDAGMHEFMLFSMNVAGTYAALKNKLPDEYWHWIQDHTYLKGPHTARPAAACKPDPQTALSVTQLVGNTRSETWVDHQNDRLVFNGSVFTYRLPNTEPFPVTWRLWFTLQGSALKPSDRTAVDTKQWGCQMQTPPVEISVAPGATFESGAIAANVELSRARDDQQPKADGNKKFRFHAKPLRGTVALEGPSGGLDALITEIITRISVNWQLSETGSGSGTYLIDLPVGTYDISVSGSNGYTARYTGVQVQEDTTVTPPPSQAPMREIVFLGRYNNGPLNLFLWDLDANTVAPLTGFSSDSWADPYTYALTFTAARRQDGSLLVAFLQDPGYDPQAGTYPSETLWLVDPSTQQATTLTQLPPSYQVSAINFDYDWAADDPRILRFYQSLDGQANELQAMSLTDGSIIWTHTLSGGNCLWRPGRNFSSGYLLGCSLPYTRNNQPSSEASILAVPDPVTGPSGQIGTNPDYLQYSDPDALQNGLIFIGWALDPQYSGTPGFVDPTSGTFTPLPTTGDCVPAPDRNQVVCSDTNGVTIYSVSPGTSGTAIIGQPETFPLPQGYTFFTQQFPFIDFVETLYPR